VESRQTKSESAVTAIPLSKDLKNELPNIKSFTRLGSGAATVRVDNIPYQETVSFADSDFFDIFDFPVLRGALESLLSNPNAIVLSEERARKYFGEKNPIGESLLVEVSGVTLEAFVTGVIDAKKTSSSIQIDLLMAFDNFEYVGSKDMMTSYKFGIVENYIQVRDPVDQVAFESLMTEAIQKYSPEDKNKLNLALQPLSNLHLQDQVLGNATYISPTKLYIMSGVGILIVLIALINFVTLSTGQAIGRLKEVGLRKTLGALNGQLRFQLASEALITVFIACIIGLSLAYFGHPLFMTLTGITFSYSFGWSQILFLGAIVLTISLIAALAQGILIIKYNASDALQGNVNFGINGDWFNRALIVFQFSVAIILIVAAMHMNVQMLLIKSKKLGYDAEKLIEISLGNPANKEQSKLLVDRFRSAALIDQRILSVSASMNNSREPWTELSLKQLDGSLEKIYYNQVDHQYMETMDISIVEGQAFKIEGSNNTSSILVNEALVKHFNWGDDVLSKQIPGANLANDHQIIGVIGDYHFSSLHEKIEPLILALDEKSISDGIVGLSTYVWPPNLYSIMVRAGSGDISAIVKSLEKAWTNINPNSEFVYHFVDEVLDAQYAEEERWSRVINLASAFTIFVAWLGLFALLRLNIRKKEKEIGIRKVLGSSSFEIIKLLTEKYLWLVILGICISIPISSWLVGKWLESFAYKINISPFLLLTSSLSILVLTMISVSFQSFRASTKNPVVSINRN
jgi:putative ABC transport system permease protein